MAVNAVNNEESASSFRATLNTWRTQINTNETNIASNTAALATKQPLDSDLTTIAGLTPSNDDFLQRKAGAWANRTVAQVSSDLGLSNKQDANSDDTLIDNVSQTASTVTIGNSDNNSFYRVTNTAATDYILPSDASAASLQVGSRCGFFNSAGSTNNVTIQNDGGSTVLYANSLTSTVTPGQAALFRKLAANTWLRIV